MQVAAAALLIYLSSDKRQRPCFFLPNSGSAATFQVAGVQHRSLALASSNPVLGLERICPWKVYPRSWILCVLDLGLEPCVLDFTSAICIMQDLKRVGAEKAMQFSFFDSIPDPSNFVRLNGFKNVWNMIQMTLKWLFFWKIAKIAQRLLD